MRVLVTHNREDFGAYYQRAFASLRELDVDIVLNDRDRDLDVDELVAAAASCDVVIAHRSTPGPARLFQECPQLVAFLRTAVDISTVDVAAASSAGVAVARADKSFVPSTAELALGLLLDVARNISSSVTDYRMGSEPPQRAGWQLAGSTAGIIGYGAIGAYLTDLLSGIGMQVVVHDPFVDIAHVEPGPAALSRVRQVSFAELLAASDVVFPLAQAEPSTENLIDAAALASMRPGAVLINVSRGELVDDDAVLAALERDHLDGVGLDVGRAADQRPTPALARHPRVVATPHLGGLTPQNADAQAASSVEQVAAMLRGELPPRTVNAEHAERLRGRWVR